MARTTKPKRPSKRTIAGLFKDVPEHRKQAALAKLMRMWEESTDDATGSEATYRSPAGKLYATKAAAETLDIILGLHRHDTDEQMAAVKLMAAIRESAKTEQAETSGGVTINFVLEDSDPEPDGQS